MSPDSSALEVVRVDPGRRRDRRAFVALPFDLARSHPHWRPGLRVLVDELVDPARNPFWSGHDSAFFLARRGATVVGRLAVVGPGQIAEHPTAATLAFPDFVNDPEVVSGLLEAVETEARALGATELVGPLNPDIHHDVGVLIEGHERPNVVFMGYQPPYYAERLEERGLRPLADFEAWGLYRDSFETHGRLRRLAERVERHPALRIRPIDLGRYGEELELFHRLYSDAFSDHWGFTAPTWEEFRFVAADMKHILRPELGLVAEWNGRPAGFVLGIPDLFSILPADASGRITPSLVLTVLGRWRDVESVRVMIAGILPEHRHRGLHLPLFYRVAEGIFRAGFRGGEISWVLTDNDPMARALPLLGAYRTKRYRLYVKALHQ